MNEAVDLLVLVDAELFAVNNSAEDVHNVSDDVYLVVDLLLLSDVGDNTDVEVDDMLLDPDR